MPRKITGRLKIIGTGYMDMKCKRRIDCNIKSVSVGVSFEGKQCEFGSLSTLTLFLWYPLGSNQ